MKKDFEVLKKLENNAWKELCSVALEYGNGSTDAMIARARWAAYDRACEIVFGNHESGQ